jgi:hypothetical protein
MKFHVLSLAPNNTAILLHNIRRSPNSIDIGSPPISQDNASLSHVMNEAQSNSLQVNLSYLNLRQNLSTSSSISATYHQRCLQIWQVK